MFGADHHTIWADTKALELSGLLNGGSVEKGAKIMMSSDGKATG